jgi:hypothetical protein
MEKFFALAFWRRPMTMAAMVLPMLVFTSIANAGTLVYDAGVRASIFDENYKLGWGLDAGAVKGIHSDWDAGIHFNYTHYRNKRSNWTPADEIGGRVSAYYLPKVDQIFSVKVGPHFGYSRIRSNYIDIGGDLLLIFKVNPKTQVVAAFIPGLFIGTHSQALVRLGLGMQYNPGL